MFRLGKGGGRGRQPNWDDPLLPLRLYRASSFLLRGEIIAAAWSAVAQESQGAFFASWFFHEGVIQAAVAEPRMAGCLQ